MDNHFHIPSETSPCQHWCKTRSSVYAITKTHNNVILDYLRIVTQMWQSLLTVSSLHLSLLSVPISLLIPWDVTESQSYRSVVNSVLTDYVLSPLTIIPSGSVYKSQQVFIHSESGNCVELQHGYSVEFLPVIVGHEEILEIQGQSSYVLYMAKTP